MWGKKMYCLWVHSLLSLLQKWAIKYPSSFHSSPFYHNSFTSKSLNVVDAMMHDSNLFQEMKDLFLQGVLQANCLSLQPRKGLHQLKRADWSTSHPLPVMTSIQWLIHTGLLHLDKSRPLHSIWQQLGKLTHLQNCLWGHLTRLLRLHVYATAPWVQFYFLPFLSTSVISRTPTHPPVCYSPSQSLLHSKPKLPKSIPGMIRKVKAGIGIWELGCPSPTWQWGPHHLW